MTEKSIFGFNPFLVLSAVLVAWVVVLQPSPAGFLEKVNLLPTETSASASHNVSGYAWSDNIGWVSFNCTNTSCASTDYGVNLDSTTGNLSGYAWSDNVGWISFNETTGCPVGTCQPRLSGGALLGWAKATAASGGWDGWISLSSANGGGGTYGITLSGTSFQNYAWGSDVIGWLQWNPAFGGVTLGATQPPVITSFTPTPPSVLSGNASTLDWTTTNAGSCTGSGGWSGSKTVPSGSQSTGPLSVDTSFTLTCTNAVGSVQQTVNVLITLPIDYSLTNQNTIRKNQLQINSSTTTIRVVPVNSFNWPVVLGASPRTIGGVNVMYYFSPSSLSLANYSSGSQLYLVSSSTIPSGTYTITVTGTSTVTSTSTSLYVRTVPVRLDTTGGSGKGVEEF